MHTHGLIADSMTDETSWNCAKQKNFKIEKGLFFSCKKIWHAWKTDFLDNILCLYAFVVVRNKYVLAVNFFPAFGTNQSLHFFILNIHVENIDLISEAGVFAKESHTWQITKHLSDFIVINCLIGFAYNMQNDYENKDKIN